MREGETISFDDALYGLMLASANDVAVGLAEHIDGSIDKFAERMNARAAALGASRTHFTNPHGYHDPDHYTTARDLTTIFRAALKYDKFREVISTVSHKIPVTNMVDEERYLNNSNKMILPYSNFYYEGAIGGKTGYTDEARHTLVTAAERDGITLVCAVMKGESNDPYTDTAALFNYGFSLYGERNLGGGDFAGTVSVRQRHNGRTYELGNVAARAEDATAIAPAFVNGGNVKRVVSMASYVAPPVKQGQKLGELTLMYNETSVAAVDIVAAADVAPVAAETLAKDDFLQKAREICLKTAKIAGLSAAAIAALIIVVLVLRALFGGGSRRRRGLKMDKGLYRRNRRR
jgi:D-alanyl-D-alanine carboxypeptidase